MYIVLREVTCTSRCRKKNITRCLTYVQRNTTYKSQEEGGSKGGICCDFIRNMDVRMQDHENKRIGIEPKDLYPNHQVNFLYL